jgi:hypothetical protein
LRRSHCRSTRERTALSLGDDAVFLDELIGDLLDGLFGLEQTGAGFAAELEVPVLGDLFGVSEALLARAAAALFAADRGRAMPDLALAAAVELQFTA